jgi:hypothetical protein
MSRHKVIFNHFFINITAEGWFYSNLMRLRHIFFKVFALINILILIIIPIIQTIDTT